MKSRLAAAMIVAILVGFVGWVGCDDGPPPRPDAVPPPNWTRAATQEADALAQALATTAPGVDAAALNVRLAFGSSADLDLYVTGPLDETVYYANTPSRIGGELIEDRRCIHAAPRVETVRFPAPLTPGRYRIGVDYPHACTETIAAAVPFAIQIDGPGRREQSPGLARYQVFEPIVLEFEIDGAATTAAGGEVDP